MPFGAKKGDIGYDAIPVAVYNPACQELVLIFKSMLCCGIYIFPGILAFKA